VFTSERGGPMSAKSFGTLFERLGRRAGMPFTIFPHMLRHACGYALANAGHDTRALQAWLGHKNIQHTVRYTELAPPTELAWSSYGNVGNDRALRHDPDHTGQSGLTVGAWGVCRRFG
jgi:integrase